MLKFALLFAAIYSSIGLGSDVEHETLPGPPAEEWPAPPSEVPGPPPLAVKKTFEEIEFTTKKPIPRITTWKKPLILKPGPPVKAIVLEKRDAKFLLGLTEYHKNNLKVAYQIFEETAAQDHPRANYFMAERFLRGNKDGQKKGMVYLEKAVALKLPEAILLLGKILLEGKLVSLDIKRAQKLFISLPLVENPDYYFYYGLSLFCEVQDSDDKMRGLNIIIYASKNESEEAKKFIAVEGLQSLLRFEYNYGLKLYQNGIDINERIRGLKLIISAANDGSEVAKKTVEDSGLADKLREFEEQAEEKKE